MEDKLGFKYVRLKLVLQWDFCFHIFFCEVILHLTGSYNIFKDLELTWTFGNGNVGFNKNHVEPYVESYVSNSA